MPIRRFTVASTPHDRRAFDDHLGVAMAAELAARAFELGAEFVGVIGFAVIGDDEAPAGRNHGLRTRRRQLDDRQAAVAERDAGRLVGPHIARVGAAMLQDIGHGAGMGGKIAARARQQSGYAAHGFADSTGGKCWDIGAECGTRAGSRREFVDLRARGGRPVALARRLIYAAIAL